MIERTAAASRPQTSEIDRERDAPPVPTKPKARDAFESAVLGAVADRRADESLRMFAANTGASAAPPNRRNDVLYIGMNMDASGTGKPQSESESAALLKMTSGHAQRIERPVTTIVENGGVKFDTSTEAGCEAFAKSLGLPSKQADLVATALTTNFEGRGRTELALLAKSWSDGEHGGTLPGRLVLSGHCYLGGVYDGLNARDFLNFASLQTLARAMPKAAGQVEDVMFSACASGKGEDIQGWRDAFPNMKSLWAYGGPDTHSPSGNQAIEHIRVWEQATRSDHVPLAKDQATPATQDAATAARIHALPMHDHISIWTATGSYRNAM